MASGSIAVCIGTPFDIALVRLQADGMADPKDRRNYRNVFDVSQHSANRVFRAALTQPEPLGFDQNNPRRRSAGSLQGFVAERSEGNVNECWHDGML